MIAIVGPTASGKSDLSLAVAEHLEEAEIINADAMQLYRGMDIGTAKLRPEERRGIPHHQLDVLEVTQEASVASYQKYARQDAKEIQARGRRPIFVGGSGLYLRAALDQIDFPGTDPAVRAALEQEAEELGAAALYERLSQQDPKAAQTIEANNLRRVIRALEVITITGQPFSANLPDYTYHEPCWQIGLRPDPQLVAPFIDKRTRGMFADGLLEETEALLKVGLAEAKTASRATGYPQAMAVIAGRLSVEEAIEEVNLATLQLAKRQIKWFKRDPRITWLDPLPEGKRLSPEELLRRLLDTQDGKALL
ncbi:tRNA (adenosine(37)-N6)-dimethylallyltransferase MiaA [Boudabousia liubingyangii]|uniref:tRNA (adenosine(37)-N6)-dimethylallyltransferase MiaA n=1 Tax=Boudabousia liubingyangii TaxID=1921764 RepID=UPI00093970D8|nr:tRNA (adenosine(37)-N6)-dimethylallyltransferase MiaA [Boudabousia liubingyangii]OKL47522.1 tRNA (adenosine(37)-N6)-dimethylallyltransferase MiaA [Boudabousia liubingyangii]